MTILILYIIGCLFAATLLYEIFDEDIARDVTRLITFYLGIIGSWITVCALIGYFKKFTKK